MVACGGRSWRRKTHGHVAGAAVIAAVVASPFAGDGGRVSGVERRLMVMRKRDNGGRRW